MTMKTNFSFEVQYLAQSDSAQAERDALMGDLGPRLQKLLATGDSAASVQVSDSHKGGNHKIVELTTTLQDAQIAAVLKAFSAQHGVRVHALE
jgi:hypothetical protein